MHPQRGENYKQPEKLATYNVAKLNLQFFSGIIAQRIWNILPKLIRQDQKWFINGRFTGENTRLIYDIIQECTDQKSIALLILIDFEKAFDSISLDFITKTFKKF